MRKLTLEERITKLERLVSINCERSRNSTGRRIDESRWRFNTARQVNDAVENGFDPSEEGGSLTSLMEAAIADNPAVARALIRAGADVNADDGRGGTALDYAVANDSKKVEQILISAGAEFGKSNKKRMSAGFPAYRGHRNPYGRDIS